MTRREKHMTMLDLVEDYLTGAGERTAEELLHGIRWARGREDDAPPWLAETVYELRAERREDLALREFKRRNVAAARSLAPRWWSRFRLGPHVWGLSARWLCFCPWNGDTAWITLPCVYFGVGTKNIELGIGRGKWHVTFDVRWRWD